ncbi:MAG: hypothetical protein AB7S75_00955 [Desulfococcaceae bacterium]
MNFNQVLEAAQQFSYEEIDLFIEILYKRHIEARRNKIAINAQEAIEAFHRGELKTETADNLIKRLHNSLKFQEENNDSDKVSSAF